MFGSCHYSLGPPGGDGDYRRGADLDPRSQAHAGRDGASQVIVVSAPYACRPGGSLRHHPGPGRNGPSVDRCTRSRATSARPSGPPWLTLLASWID